MQANAVDIYDGLSEIARGLFDQIAIDVAEKVKAVPLPPPMSRQQHESSKVACRPLLIKANPYNWQLIEQLSDSAWCYLRQQAGLSIE